MASKQVVLQLGVYVQLDTGADTAIDAQNVSNQSNVKVIFAATQPAVSAVGAYILKPGDVIPRIGKADLMWAMAMGPDALVTVGE